VIFSVAFTRVFVFVFVFLKREGSYSDEKLSELVSKLGAGKGAAGRQKFSWVGVVVSR